MGSGSSSAAIASADTALKVLNEDMPGDDADVAAQEAKQNTKEKAALGKKLKMQQRAFANMVSLLAKCRSLVLMDDPDRAPVLNKLEKECCQLKPKPEGDDVTMEELDGKIQGITLVRCLPIQLLQLYLQQVQMEKMLDKWQSRCTCFDIFVVSCITYYASIGLKQCQIMSASLGVQ